MVKYGWVKYNYFGVITKGLYEINWKFNSLGDIMLIPFGKGNFPKIITEDMIIDYVEVVSPF